MAYDTGAADGLKVKPISGAPTNLTGAQMVNLARIVLTAYEDAPAIAVRICAVDIGDHSGGDPAPVCRAPVGGLGGPPDVAVGFHARRPPLSLPWQKDPVLVEQ